MAFDYTQFGLGWNPEQEAQHALTFARTFQPLCAAGEKIPDNVDPRGKLLVCNQGPLNTCEGNGRKQVVQFINWIKTGELVAISARFAYLTTKIVDGTIDGPDAGASIAGGALASQRFGECLEEVLPYWDWQHGEKYSNGIPEAAKAQGSVHRLVSFAPVRCYEDWISGIGQGLGAILFGVRWTTGLAGCNGTYDDMGGRFLGGHAQAGCGYVTRGQEKWPIVFNSHGLGWGDQSNPAWRGTALMPPKSCDWICRNSPYPPVLMSDMPVFRQRKFHDFTGVIPCTGILPQFTRSESA